MFRLMAKDILIQKKQLLFSLVYLAFILFAFQGLGVVMYPMALVAITYMLSMTDCAYEEKNKTDLLLNSLPINRRNIVASKYISALLYAVMGTLAYMVMITIVRLLNIPLKTYVLSPEIVISGFAAVCLMVGLWFPIYFRFGYIKMRVINFVLFFLFFFGSSFLTRYLESKKYDPWDNGIISFINSQSDITIGLMLIVIIALYMILSFLLSVWFYNRREF